ncbi:MAG: DivIVA domain-containing protein [Firmicutes bacterium]|nr:DivIVA domain-containing protein [Bacillota bacterium]
MITPTDIENKVFSRGVRGYKEDEVDDFLDLIILDMEKLLKENRQLKLELEKAQGQVDRHVSTEGSVLETLEAAKALMNDIAASAERRAQVILKDAELEAAMITREARESIGRLTEEGNRLHRSVEHMREKYRHILEMELERVDSVGADLFEELEGDFLPASIAGLHQMTGDVKADESAQPDPKARPMSDTRVVTEKKAEPEVQDLTKTIVNIK